MKSKISILLIALTLLSILVTILIYPYLPDQVPTQWGGTGGPNNYSDKQIVFVFASLPIIGYLVIMLLKKIDPNNNQHERYSRTFSIFECILFSFFISFHWIVILDALGKLKDSGSTITVIGGTLLIVTGNYTGRLKPNHFFGVRNVWTLPNEIVWKKVNRLMGKLIVVLGVIMIGIGSTKIIFEKIHILTILILLLATSSIFSYKTYIRKTREM